MSQFVSGFRVLRRQGLYGFVAVLGLAIGLAVAVTALLFAWQETHYDSHIPNAENIHLIDATVRNPGRSTQLLAQAPGGLAPAIDGTVTGVASAARVWRQWSTLSLEDRLNFNLQIIGVDPGWLEMIDLPVVEGSRDAIAGDVTAVMVSTSMAERLYGSLDVVGETFEIDETVLTVGGVFQDFPEASHMAIDVIMRIDGQPIMNRGISVDEQWSSFNAFTYVELEPGVDRAAATADIMAVLERNYQVGPQFPAGTALSDFVEISLQSLADLHLNDRTYPWGVKPPADKLKLAVLSAIAILIVVIACINHVNMSTVRSMERAREVAMRKILGAGRKQLVLQFLTEAAILASVALVFALVIVELTLPYTSELLQTELDISGLARPSFMLWLGGLMLFVVAAAGLYPAYIISAGKPGRALQENARGARGSSRLRSVLVVFQFAVSITLAIGAAVIWSQLKFARTADLGFEADNVVMLYGVGRGPRSSIQLTRSLEQSISGRPGIEIVTASNSTPAWDYVPEVSVRSRSEAPEAAVTMGRVSVGLDWFDMMRIEPVAGRTFSEDFGGDRLQWDYEGRVGSTVPVVVNERAVFTLGFSSVEEAIGQSVQFTISAADDRPAEIVGVVPNVHFMSLRNAIQPMVYYPDPSVFNVMMVRIDPNQTETAMQSIEKGWSAVLSGQAVSSDYLAASLSEQYDAEAQELKTVTVLAGLGILIAVFGQYGLAAYSAQSRRREISIRKVLGARVRDILQLFLWQFSKPVFLAMVVAWPVAFLAMSAWLENFVYRVAPNPLWFLLAGIAALTVALITVAGHALRAARAQPVEALRYE